MLFDRGTLAIPKKILNPSCFSRLSASFSQSGKVKQWSGKFAVAPANENLICKYQQQILIWAQLFIFVGLLHSHLVFLLSHV